MHGGSKTWLPNLSVRLPVCCLRYVLQTYVRPKMVLERGEGVNLWDTEGKQYLDFAAGIAVNSLGMSCRDAC